MYLKNAKPDDCLASDLVVKSSAIKCDQCVTNSWTKWRINTLDYWILIIVKPGTGVAHVIASIKRNLYLNPCIISIHCITLLVE
jgi:hypothetical protein